jgi:2-oxoglutarate ferredoxin oxidoreductase subunit beta
VADAKLQPADFNTTVRPTWCPGCGNFSIWGATKNALVRLELEPADFAVVWGIGCHGNGADFLKVAGFHGLHGRALPVATGIRLANHRLKVIVDVGDGDGYGIGGNHFIHSMRRNLDLTLLGHNNQVYGLTTGQTSPTSDQGFATPSTPSGVLEKPVNPIALALASDCTFVARGFAGDIAHLSDLIAQGITHSGFALIDILQPCVTFNKRNTYQWFRERVYKLDEDGHDSTDKRAAFDRALEMETEERIGLGVFYREQRPTYEDGLPQLAVGPLVDQSIEEVDISGLIEQYA